MNEHALRARWQAAWVQVGAQGNADLVFAALHRAYTEPQRFYHTLAHIQTGLALLDNVISFAQQPATLLMAWWWHDAVYDSHAHDNEARSAAWSAETLQAAQVAPPMVQEIQALILATQHQAPPPTPDAALLVDVDLAILGSAPPDFDAYEAAVRQEYAWVPEPMYRAGRAKILRQFLERPTIFNTLYFKTLYEEAARANLARSLQKLQG